MTSPTVERPPAAQERLSTGSRASAHRVSEHVLTRVARSEPSRGVTGVLTFVSLIDDAADVWKDEDFRLVDPLSTVTRWSRPDEFAAVLRDAAWQSPSLAWTGRTPRASARCFWCCRTSSGVCAGTDGRLELYGRNAGSIPGRDFESDCCDGPLVQQFAVVWSHCRDSAVASSRLWPLPRLNLLDIAHFAIA